MAQKGGQNANAIQIVFINSQRHTASVTDQSVSPKTDRSEPKPARK